MKYRSFVTLLLLTFVQLLVTVPTTAAGLSPASAWISCTCEGAEYDICNGDVIELSCATYATCEPYCTKWLPELYLTEDSHSGDLVIRVAPEVSTIYTFYVSDERGEIVDEVVFKVNVHEPFEAEVEASNTIICDGNPIELKALPAGPTYTYDWADLDSEPEPGTRMVDLPQTYTVTVTDTETNCTSVASIEIAANDGPDSEDAMLGFFRSKGFLEFEIIILEEEGLANPGATATRKNLDLIRNEFPRLIEFEENDNRAIELEALLEAALGGDELTTFNRKGYITGNYSFCEPGSGATPQTVIEEICSDFETRELSYWVHLWENPDPGEKDRFFIRAQTPTHEEPTPDSGLMAGYITDLVAEVSTESEIYTYGSKSEQEVDIVLDQLQDFYDLPLEERSAPAEEATESSVGQALQGELYGCEELEIDLGGRDYYYLNAAGRALKLPDNAVPVFLPRRSRNYDNDSRALMGFVQQGNNPQRWISHGKPGGKHAGFKLQKNPKGCYQFPPTPPMVCRGPIINDPADLVHRPLFIMGSSTQNGDCFTLGFNTQRYTPTDSYLTRITTAGCRAGDPQLDFATSGTFCAFNDSLLSVSVQSCIPPLSENVILDAEQDGAFNPWGQRGVLFDVSLDVSGNGTREREWVYARFQGNETEPWEQMTYYIWSCARGGWVELTVVAPYIKDRFNDLADIWELLFGQASVSTVGHTGLDALGMVPIIGAPADLISATWYLVEGDYGNAGFALVGLLPLIGDGIQFVRSTSHVAEVVLHHANKVFRPRLMFKMQCVADGRTIPGGGFSVGVASPYLLNALFTDRCRLAKEFLIVIQNIAERGRVLGEGANRVEIPAQQLTDLVTFLRNQNSGEALSLMFSKNPELIRSWSRTFDEQRNLLTDEQRLELFAWILRNENNPTSRILATFTDPARWNLVRAWEVLYPSANRFDLDYLHFFERSSVLRSNSAIINAGLPSRYPDLSIEDITAIHHYTDDSYFELNEALRTEAMTPHLTGFSTALNNALNKLPDFTGTTYRGTTIPESVVMTEYWEAYRNGQREIREKDFTSTSRSSNVAEAFANDVLASGELRVFFTINASTGKNIDEFSAHGPSFIDLDYSESEVLFKSGESFNVREFEDAVDLNGDRIILITLEN